RPLPAHRPAPLLLPAARAEHGAAGPRQTDAPTLAKRDAGSPAGQRRADGHLSAGLAEARRVGFSFGAVEGRRALIRRPRAPRSRRARLPPRGFRAAANGPRAEAIRGRGGVLR